MKKLYSFIYLGLGIGLLQAQSIKQTDLLEKAKVDAKAELVADFALRGRAGTLDVYKIQSWAWDEASR